MPRFYGVSHFGMNCYHVFQARQWKSIIFFAPPSLKMQVQITMEPPTKRPCVDLNAPLGWPVLATLLLCWRSQLSLLLWLRNAMNLHMYQWFLFFGQWDFLVPMFSKWMLQPPQVCDYWREDQEFVTKVPVSQHIFSSRHLLLCFWVNSKSQELFQWWILQCKFVPCARGTGRSNWITPMKPSFYNFLKNKNSPSLVWKDLGLGNSHNFFSNGVFLFIRWVFRHTHSRAPFLEGVFRHNRHNHRVDFVTRSCHWLWFWAWIRPNFGGTFRSGMWPIYWVFKSPTGELTNQPNQLRAIYKSWDLG